jgi:hypothetical protein
LEGIVLACLLLAVTDESHVTLSKRPKQTVANYARVLYMNLVPPSTRFFFSSGPKIALLLSYLGIE